MDDGGSEVSGPATVSIKAKKGQPANLLIQISEDDDGSTAMSSVFTLCNSAIGAGVLSLPYAFRKSGEPQPCKGPSRQHPVPKSAVINLCCHHHACVVEHCLCNLDKRMVH